MEISRLTFTKETKEKMEKELNGFQKGKLRWEKLKEADREGRLSLAKNRYELSNLAGFASNEAKRGYQWIAARISKGQIKETIHQLGTNGKMEYEYHLGEEPDYDHKKARALRWVKHEEETAPVQKDTGKTMIWIDESVKDTKTYRLEFSRGDVVIKLEIEDYNEVIETIKTILKGE